MALSFDDRILGEKTDYYCSSESEEYDSCEEFEDAKDASKSDSPTCQPNALHSDGAPNTGPKGVIEDWRRYKQLETERREEAAVERLALAKKLAITCRTNAKDEEERAKDREYVEEMEDNLEDFDEEFMRLYRLKRIEALRSKTATLPKFGRVLELNKTSFLEAIDNENPLTTIVIHIYKHGVKACGRMNECFGKLSSSLPSVKFCCLEASHVQLSLKFSISGVPAILVYKQGDLVGNFVKLRDEFGDDFCASDVESFLVEHGLLPDSTCDLGPNSIRNACSYGEDDDEEDDED